MPTSRRSRHARAPRTRRAPSFVAAALVAAVASLGCVGDTITSRRSGECEVELTTTVSAGTTPTFTWTPACKVTRLLVLHESDGAEAWAVESGANEIASGVKYGVVPPGATQSAPPAALVAGQAYDLVLIRTSALGGLEVAGGKSFTP